MLNLTQSLSKYDLAFLRIIAQLWGIELAAKNHNSVLTELAISMLQKERVVQLIISLPEEAQAILADLSLHHGQIRYSHFERKYGGIREIGAGKRDREKVYLHPLNASEILWYRGLIFRDFFSVQGPIEEFVYCPEELLKLIPTTALSIQTTATLPAFPDQYQTSSQLEDRILDDCCTYLSYLRKGDFTHNLNLESCLMIPSMVGSLSHYSPPTIFFSLLLEAGGLIKPDGTPISDSVRSFLADSRSNSYKRLFQSWIDSTNVNELRLLPEIECLGDWQNDPLSTRQFILKQIYSFEPGKWFNLDSFIQMIYEIAPDFQRPSGNFEVWIIRDQSTQEFLSGFESWHFVEGRLLNYFICGPLYWFGLIELGSKDNNSPILSFRINSKFKDLLENEPTPQTLPEETEKIRLQSNDKITIGRFVPRTVRYQIARFCDWAGIKNESYLYLITSQSLTYARKHNLSPRQLLTLLRKNSIYFPANLTKALIRWESNATEIQIQQMPILQVQTPEILETIKKSRLSRHIQNYISPTVAILIPGSEQIVLKGLFELGYIAELSRISQSDNPSKKSE